MSETACVCHGEDRPHRPHQPCDMGCQPDWHRDGCAIYLPLTPTTQAPHEAPAASAAVHEEDAHGRH